jgi:hypothetical protein
MQDKFPHLCKTRPIAMMGDIRAIFQQMPPIVKKYGSENGPFTNLH